MLTIALFLLGSLVFTVVGIGLIVGAMESIRDTLRK